jgi:DMSO/TMAO reductase YedYZ molybdopterin-dependent catalytic subunit
MGTRASYKWRSDSFGKRDGMLILSRRAFLGGGLAAAAWGQQQQPEISAFDLSLLDEGLTPAESFFVREHFPLPKLSAHDWKLQLAGAVTAPFEISYDDLLRAPRKTLPITLECAENPVGGGLVSTAEWTGVTLDSLLQQAQPTAEARAVRFVAADGYQRSIPLEKARHADTLIAHGMNGERLPEKHGFPLRAVIPGWYGMDAVKGLQRIEVLSGEDTSAATRDYLRLTRSLLLGVRPAGPVTAMAVKAAFSRPVDGAVLIGRQFIVRGAAWAGENRVQSVEVSVDGAKSWAPARLATDPQPYAWSHWSFSWKIPGPGAYDLAVRASDDAGRTQPAERARDRADNYEQNSWQAIRVAVT